MSATIIDGKSIAESIKQSVKKEADALKSKGLVPGLATILVGDNPGSQVYIRNKIKACEAAGIKSFHNTLPKDVSQEQVLDLIRKYNRDPKVHGILVQLPLPMGHDSGRVIMEIDPAKDVDGFHPMNVGRFVTMKSWDAIEQSDVLLPCTPFGIIKMLQASHVPVGGAHAVVVGRSNLVGKPVSLLLASCDATVTLCHSQTKDLPKLCAEADILIAAIGKPKFITGGMIKKGSVVIDVGMNRTAEGLCGDVEFETAKERASMITHVPGGVGPMTVTMLLQNTVKAAKFQNSSGK